MKIFIFAFLAIIYSQLSLASAVSLDKTMHDPTMPANYNLPVSKSGNVELELIMTFVSSKGRIAIINGSTYEEGSVIDNFKVVKIDSNKVKLVSINGSETIVLVPKQNKKSSLISGAN
ncbi:MAG: hypothetical protein HON55_05240 [Legionellales bacterium]|jgi:hypothetical protein|nr:hypothetical protein [Legionellales bacterium]